MCVQKPNFFIIGAPKCGTTSVYRWLSERPDVFMAPKELHYFNSDARTAYSPTRGEYENYFPKSSAPSFTAVGEASVWYLYSDCAIANIEAYAEKPRYIVCVRDPSSMAVSLHRQELFNGIEDVEDFLTAWNLSEERYHGRYAPRMCLNPQYLAYHRACCLGTQLLRLYERVPKERVLVVALDDLQERPEAQYGRILKFLDLSSYVRESEFARHNPATQRRSSVLRHLVLHVNRLKLKLGVRAGLGILNKLDALNTRFINDCSIPLNVRRSLQAYFLEEVETLEQLLNRDLQAWKPEHR